MKRILFLCALTTSAVFANGGGYIRGGVSNSGDLTGFEPKSTEHIAILDEKLHIRPGKTQASVEVRYLMKNMSGKKVNVRFGFPVEESFGNPSVNDVSHLEQQEEPVYCKNYQVTAGGNPLKVKWQDERNPEKDERMKHLSGWNISELAFDKDQEIPVMIRFDSEYPREYWSVSENGTESAGIFRYRLSTAACWHGPIVQGRIVVEPDGIEPDAIRIIKPVNRFKKDGESWIWEFKNLEPTLADDIEIECQPATRTYGRQIIGEYREGHPSHLYADYIERRDRWSMLHSNYTVKASSTLKPGQTTSYAPENIRNRWEEKAWSEGADGPGAGEWLEITPVAPKPLLNIILKPGYQKKDLFKANARPKTIRIELNGEHRFEVDVPDREEEIEIPITDYDKAVSKIRLTFTEVYPGSRYEDLCVTSVLLHARLDRKPEIRPSR